MDYRTLPDRIARIDNLKQFADRSGIPRRTLQRMMLPDYSPGLIMCGRVEQKLKEIKPKMRPA